MIGDLTIHEAMFRNSALLREALTHRSALPSARGGRRKEQAGQAPGHGSNERLEFVGDRVLGLLMAEWLAERFPMEQEGALGQRHAQLVSRPVLAAIAERAGLPGLLHVAPNEARAGVTQLATVLADAMEAVIGALYLDSGLDAARVYVRQAWDADMQAQREPPKDPKTRLQERVLARGGKLPEYQVVATDGPSHAPSFTVQVSAHGLHGQGQAGSKREAERLAAAALLEQLG